MAPRIVKPKIFQIQNKFIDKLKEISSIRTYPHQADLYYEGQTPIVAYLLLQGRAHFTKNSKVKGTIESGHIIGLRELWFHQPSKLGARAMPNSEICFLDKSTIQEIINGHHGEIEQAFLSLVSG
jgi:CRP-like cAMP-binding protein